jgi:hypothetical protein
MSQSGGVRLFCREFDYASPDLEIEAAGTSPPQSRLREAAGRMAPASVGRCRKLRRWSGSYPSSGSKTGDVTSFIEMNPVLWIGRRSEGETESDGLTGAKRVRVPKNVTPHTAAGWSRTRRAIAANESA